MRFGLWLLSEEMGRRKYKEVVVAKLMVYKEEEKYGVVMGVVDPQSVTMKE